MIKIDEFACRIRYNGYPFMKTPDLQDLPTETQDALLQKLKLDQKLYDFVLERFKALIEAEGPSFQEELKVFREAQRVLQTVCLRERNHPACIWYKLNDLQFFRMISHNVTPMIPFYIRHDTNLP